MAAELRAWEKAQLDYYASPARWHSTYPPVLSTLARGSAP